MALRRHVANLPPAEKLFIGIDNQKIFGHTLEGQRRTPYLANIDLPDDAKKVERRL